MSVRYCRQCRAEVEDAGGFCLVGHSLRESAPVASLRELRDEVDSAFEEARMQVTQLLGQRVAPPPPPAPEAPRAYQTIDDPVVGTDPLDEFAPAPRMDWGPVKQSLLKRRS